MTQFEVRRLKLGNGPLMLEDHERHPEGAMTDDDLACYALERVILALDGPARDALLARVAHVNTTKVDETPAVWTPAGVSSLVVVGVLLLALLALLFGRKPVKPVKEEPSVVHEATETDVAMVSRTRRFDDDVAAWQRRLCVPLVRWTNAVEVVSERRCFFSAQFGADEHGIISPRPDQQCEATFVNLHRALTHAGRSMADLVKLTVYMVYGRCSLAEYRSVEARYLPRDALPAVTIVFVPALATQNILVQIDAVSA